MEKANEQIIKRVYALDDCIGDLEITAINFYDPQGELFEGWNLLFSLRDELKKFRDKELSKLNE